MTTIYLLRHGQTDFNKQGLLQGKMNKELNKEGMRQVEEARKKFQNYEVDVCFSSPLIRAMQTSFTVVGDRCLIVKDDRLMERSMGELEGKERDKYDTKKYWDYELNSSLHGVEAIVDVYQRSEEILQEILSKYKDKKILIVSHGSIIRCMHNLLNHYPKDNFSDVDIGNCYFEEIFVSE